MPMHRVAAVQCTSGNNTEANKAALALQITEAASQGAELILLPEMCLNMDGSQYADIATDRSVTEWLAQQASQNSVWLVAGAVPQTSPDGDPRVRSAMLVFNDAGEQVARYDKVHLFDVDVGDKQGSYRESERFSPGNEIMTVDTPVGRSGLSICFDIRFPEHYIALREAGAEIILVPAAFTYTTGQAHWEVLLRARAIETQCYLIAANQCGWHDDKRRTWGHSMIIDPWGNILAEAADEACVVCADIDPDEVHERRQRMPIR